MESIVLVIAIWLFLPSAKTQVCFLMAADDTSYNINTMGVWSFVISKCSAYYDTYPYDMAFILFVQRIGKISYKCYSAALIQVSLDVLLLFNGCTRQVFVSTGLSRCGTICGELQVIMPMNNAR